MKVLYSLTEINCVIQKLIDMTVFQLVGFAVALQHQRQVLGIIGTKVGLILDTGPALILDRMIGTVNDMSDIYWSYNKVDCESPFYDEVHPLAKEFYEKATVVQPYNKVTDIEGLIPKYCYFMCDLYCRMAFLEQDRAFDFDIAYINSFYRHKILALRNLDQNNFNISCLCEVVTVSWECLNKLNFNN